MGPFSSATTKSVEFDGFKPYEILRRKSVEKSVEFENPSKNPSKNPTNSTGFQTINFENAEDFPAKTSDVIIRQTFLSIPGAFLSDFLLKNNDFQ